MARRGWGDDSIYWWEARKRFVGEVSRGFDADGRRVRKKVYGRTKTEVRDKLKELKRQLDAQEHNQPTASPPQEVTVRQCAEAWLVEGLSVSAQTAQKNRDCLIPILAAIGDKQLRELSAGDVYHALSQMAATRASSTVSVAHSALKRAIRHAEARDLVGRNVATLIDTPKGMPGRRSRSLTMDQAVALIEEASQERPRAPVHPGLRPQEPRPAALMYAYIVVSLATGLRTEEIRELRWNHVVAWADGQWLSVTSAGWQHEQFAVLVWRSVREDGDTKTELSRRSLELPKLAVQALMQWQLAQADEHLAADVRWHATGLVFTTATGTSLAAGHVRRMFKNVCKAAGIGESWTPRELRHSFVSLMSDRGMATEEIARLVGHRSTRTTETVYRHELRPVIRSGAAIMNKIFSESELDRSTGT
jgi:integrase